MLKIPAVLLCVRVSHAHRLVGGRFEIRKEGDFVSTSHGVRQNASNLSTKVWFDDNEKRFREESNHDPIGEAVPVSHLMRQSISSKAPHEDSGELLLNKSRLHSTRTKTTQSTSDRSVVTEMMPKSLVSETFFANAVYVQGKPQADPQKDLHTASSRFVSAFPKGSASSLQNGLSAFNELSLVAYPNGSEFGLTPKNGSKVDAWERFFQAAGIMPGDACKTSGFFQGRGCAIGCSCQFWQYCDKTTDDASEFINVGICTQSWALPLLAICLMSCICYTCYTQSDQFVQVLRKGNMHAVDSQVSLGDGSEDEAAGKEDFSLQRKKGKDPSERTGEHHSEDDSETTANKRGRKTLGGGSNRSASRSSGTGSYALRSHRLGGAGTSSHALRQYRLGDEGEANGSSSVGLFFRMFQRRDAEA